MKIASKILDAMGLEKRSIGSSYSSFWKNERMAGVNGISSPEAHPVAYSCIGLISESLASIPLNLIEKGTRSGADTPLHDVLHYRWNENTTALEGREHLAISILTTGNGYAEIKRNGAGEVVALYSINPKGVTVERLQSGRLRYKYIQHDGSTRTMLEDDVLHVRHRSSDGLIGVSPIKAVADTFELASQQHKYSSRLMKLFGRPTGAVALPAGSFLKGEQFDRFKDQVNSGFDGGGVPLLEGGMQWVPIALSNRDNQFMEHMQLTALDICRVFSVPPPMVGILDNATYSNIQEQTSMLVKHCLRPWMVRIEQAMMLALLTPEGRSRYQIEHNAEGLLRGNQEDRFKSYRIAREWGWMSVNEIRKLENMPVIGEAGDEYRVPLNSAPIDDAGDE